MKITPVALAKLPKTVGIIGGGLSGTLAALTLKQRLGNGVDVTILDASKRKVGGRLLGGLVYDEGRYVGDMGAQFIQPTSNFRFAQLCKQMHQMGLLAPWKGRFGVLGSQGGGFLPSSIVQTAIPKHSDETPQSMDSVDNGDFCNFNRSSTFKVPTYTVVPSMGDLCERMLQTQPDIKQTLNFTLDEAVPVPNSNAKGDDFNTDIMWKLKRKSSTSSSNDENCYYDAIILSTHNPSLASSTINNILMNYEEQEEEIVVKRLQNLSKALINIRQNKKPVLSFAFLLEERISKTLPFDAVTIPGSPILQFLCRESSKPGREVGGLKQSQLWKGISTSQFAQKYQQDNNVNCLLEREAQNLLSNYSQTTVKPKLLGNKLWRAAFSQPTLNSKEDCITLEPWRFIIAGDFLRNYNNPIEAAAVSGMDAGDRMASILSTK